MTSIGIDLGGTKIEGIALAPDGEELARIRIPTPRGSYPDTLAAIVSLVHALETKTATTGTVGLGIPGAESTLTGNIKNANSTWLIGQPLRHDLEQGLGRPVRLSNDANCFALSEATDGAAAGAELVFGVILGTGVGGGIVVRQQVLRGANAIAGEWGHNPLPWPQALDQPLPECYCGRAGCIETYLSGPGLAKDHTRVTGQVLAPEAIVAGAIGGDAGCIATLDRYIERLARALATVINVLDPDVIVLGGGLSNVEALYAETPQRWDPYVFSDEVRTRLVRARHGDSSGVRGAAWLWND
ncbi:ROK family protein [Propionivibrio dicarboxylicus]|uniref:N-acetylglucosamine kinase n=1 Tax=Propionivibrio dicarboxylicus TaxID=83767 RepID=A0A1G8JE96_9RHOO|nr:ROK family protein [Propionivibrio dicarboxylicus]SDI29383.1 N-acetylglucosamine kinase [Propionivibrio dicarboxylicus]